MKIKNRSILIFSLILINFYIKSQNNKDQENIKINSGNPTEQAEQEIPVGSIETPAEKPSDIMPENNQAPKLNMAETKPSDTENLVKKESTEPETKPAVEAKKESPKEPETKPANTENLVKKESTEPETKPEVEAKKESPKEPETKPSDTENLVKKESTEPENTESENLIKSEDLNKDKNIEKIETENLIKIKSEIENNYKDLAELLEDFDLLEDIEKEFNLQDLD